MTKVKTAPTKAAKKSAEDKDGPFECKHVEKLAWNNERVVLENDDVHAVLTIKNPEHHGFFKAGDLYDLHL
jgi:hypothetical protein